MFVCVHVFVYTYTFLRAVYVSTEILFPKETPQHVLFFIGGSALS